MIVIREIRDDDAPAVSHLIERVYRQFNEPVLPPALVEIIEPGNIISKSQTGYLYMIAELNGQPMGVITMKERTHLYHLFIDGDLHGQGLAKKLWRSLLIRLEEEGELPEELTVNATDYALGFYVKLGFCRSGPKQELNGIPFTPMKIRSNEARERAGATGKGKVPKKPEL